MKNRLEEIEKRLAAATPGPWAEHTSGHYGLEGLSKEVKSVPNRVSICDMVYGTSYDRDLIANAPTDIAALLAVVKFQDETLKEVIRNSRDVVAKKLCSRTREEVEKILGNE